MGLGETDVFVLLHVGVSSREISDEASCRPFELLRVASTEGLLSVCIWLVIFRVVEPVSADHDLE